jgi:transposase
VEALRAQAGQRLDAQRRRCGLALRSMRDRGESMREIAQMAGIADKTVRELIKAAEPTASAAAPAWADRPAAVGTARVASDAPA